MPHNTTDFIHAVIGDIDHIIEELSLKSLPAESQAAIVGRFSEILLHRLLLRVPEQHIETIKHSLEGNPEAFAAALETTIPDIENALREDFEQTLSDFQRAGE